MTAIQHHIVSTSSAMGQEMKSTEKRRKICPKSQTTWLST